MTVSRGQGLDVWRGPGQPGHSPHPLIPSTVITPRGSRGCALQTGEAGTESSGLADNGYGAPRAAPADLSRCLRETLNFTFRVVSQSYGQEDYGNSRPRGTSLSLPTHTTVVQSCAHQLPPPLGGRQKETSSAPDRKSQQAGQLSPPGEDKQDGKGTGQTSGADWRALRATGAAHGRERRAGAREIKHSQQDTGHQKRAGVGNRKKVSEIGNKGNNGRQTDRQTGGQKRSEC